MSEDGSVGPEGNISRVLEASALRQYLQRTEVRLSTMHRIAGVFLNGAGLLVLIPILYGTSSSNIIAYGLKYDGGSDSGAALTGTMVGLSILVSIPLVSIYLLLRELVLFYFAPSHFEQVSNLRSHPRFVLSGLAFPVNDSPSYKSEILSIQREEDSLQNFVLGESARGKGYFKGILKDTQGQVIPPYRQQYWDGRDADPDNFTLLNVAFGLTATFDRDLVREAAKAEVSTVRHALILRRLVLRYSKALLLAVWTTLVMLVASAVSDSESLVYGTAGLVISFVGLVGASVSVVLVSLPIRWIASLEGMERDSVRDPDLFRYERGVRVACGFAIAAFSASVALGLWA